MIWRLFDDYPAHVAPFLRLEDMHEDPYYREERTKIRREILDEASRLLREVPARDRP